MKSEKADILYRRIIESDSDIRSVFASLNLIHGYDILNDIEASEEEKNAIIRYVALAYTYRSDQLRVSKDRTENKKTIAAKANIPQRLLEDIANNRNESVNKFITWWLEETADPLWHSYISGMDLVSELLMFARTGLNISFTVSDEDEANTTVKEVKKDFQLKAQAYMNARKIQDQLDKDGKTLEVKYEYIEGVVKREVPEMFADTENMAEYLAKKARKKNESKQRQNHPALQKRGH